jgi:hypothetical protein
MTRTRLAARPNPDRTTLAEARTHGLPQRHQTRLSNARGRELTHTFRTCEESVHLTGYVHHTETCHQPTTQEPPTDP